MNLKGYNYYRKDKNGKDEKAVMSFMLKRLDLILWDDVSQKEYDDFCKYLDDQGWKTRYLDLYGHKIIKKED